MREALGCVVVVAEKLGRTASRLLSTIECRDATASIAHHRLDTKNPQRTKKNSNCAALVRDYAKRSTHNNIMLILIR